MVSGVGFEIGSVPFNKDGWGPPETPTALLSDHPTNVPFAPFNRSDKLGRIADWTRNNNYNQSRNNPRNPTESAFDFSLDESAGSMADDESFRLVDGKPPPRPKFGPKWRFQQQRQLPQRKDEEVEAKKREAEKERARRDRHYNMNRSGGNQPRREAAVFKSSVDIQPEWTMLDQIPFSTFSKLSFNAPEPEDLLICGALEYYDKSYDRINPKNEKRLERFKNRNFFKVTTTDDPIIRRLANEDKATVFATDAILSTLMCAPRSVYSWDIVIQRVGNKLFLDKRDGSQLDLLSVNETSQEPLPEAKEDINSAYSLSVEAAYINQNFSQLVLVRDGNKVGFEEGNPFASEGEEVASAAYRYRRWKLDNEMYLVARCEVHSAAEYSGVDWRKKLETQRGAVLATELKNNANKLAKWTAQALLASADVMKLGYVSRVHPCDHFNHAILAVLKEGKYVLVKDPSKPQVRIYEVPADAFENDYVEEPLPEDEQV
ncbi:Eukaryotic translation initiation factor 3 subunit D [Ranunculus cassubicifolius]